MGTVEYAYITFADDDLFREAQENLAALFDLAVNECRIDSEAVVGAFIASGLARQFERLNPVFVAGKSAIELLESLEPHVGRTIDLAADASESPSVDYWVGWSVARYQHETRTRYQKIFETIPYQTLADSYYPLHEADEEKFVEVIRQHMHSEQLPTRLAIQRKLARLSQAELARKSGVSIRSVQMYEQRNKNINKASVETVYRLAYTLHCEMTDLMEFG